MNKIKYVTLKNNYSNHLEAIVDFYEPKYKKIFNNDTVLNSTIICLAFFDNKIIGAVRALSDLSRLAVIADLIVDKEYRKMGVGKSLLKNIVDELLKYKVATISLTTEPDSPWLVDFYAKNGFKTISDSHHMIYRTKKSLHN